MYLERLERALPEVRERIQRAGRSDADTITLAVEEGSTMLRLGTVLLGERR